MEAVITNLCASDSAFSEALERFSLAEPGAARQAVLDALPDGSWERAMLSVLHLQGSGPTPNALAATEAAVKRLCEDRDHARASAGRACAEALRLRGALLEPDVFANADAARLLKDALGANTDAPPPRASGGGGVSAAEAQLPSRLDESELHTQHILQAHLPQLRESRGWSALRPAAVPLVAPLVGLGDEYADALALLLDRLQTADVDGLVAAVAADLRRGRCEWGGRAVHASMTLDQLMELREQLPMLTEQPQFVQAVLGRLSPPDGTPAWDEAALAASLQAVWAFVSALPGATPAHQRLRARVLAAILARKIRAGDVAVDDPALLEFCSIRVLHSLTDTTSTAAEREQAVRLDAYGGLEVPLAPPLTLEEHTRIVRHWVLWAYAPQGGPTPALEQRLNARALADLAAAGALEVGAPGAEEQAARLGRGDPVAALGRSVLLRWSDRNASWFAPAEPVALSVVVRNVPELRVRVFEVDTTAHLRAHGAEPSAAMELDGLVPTWEGTESFARPAVREERALTLPALPGRGTFVVDLIGGGGNTRALVRKGALRLVERPTVAGHVCHVLDEGCEPIAEGVSLTLGGQRFAPLEGEGGAILVPYSTAASGSGGATKSVVLTVAQPRDGDDAWTFSSLAALQHRAESYELAAAVHIGRESLRAGEDSCSLAVRTALTVCGAHAPQDVLEDVCVTVTTTDADGVPAREESRDVQLRDGCEWTGALRVPERLRSVEVRVTASVKKVSTGGVAALETVHELRVNQEQATSDIVGVHLRRHAVDGWQLLTLGRSGEPVPHTPVAVALQHRMFSEHIRRQLVSDARGVVVLGRLAEIERVAVDGGRSWTLPRDAVTLPAAASACTGDAWQLVLPFVHRSADAAQHVGNHCDGCREFPIVGDRFRCQQCPDYDLCAGCFHGGERRGCSAQHAFARAPADKPLARAEAALVETRGGLVFADHFDKLSLENGYLRVAALPAGSFQLLLKREGHAVDLVVADAPPTSAARDFVAAGARLVRRPQFTRPRLNVVDLAVTPEAMTVQLAGASEDARVHVVASQLLHADFAAALGFAAPDGPVVLGAVVRPQSEFTLRRKLGDESRYVVDRQGLVCAPGVHLDAPSLLLRPWTVGTAAMERQEAEAGEGFSMAPSSSAAYGAMGGGGGGFGSGGGEQRLRASAKMAKRKRGARRTAGGRPDYGVSVDWLAAGGIKAYNLRPDAEGRVVVPLGAVGDCAVLEVVAVDRRDSVTRYAALPPPHAAAAAPGARALQLQTPLPAGVAFAREDRAQALAADLPVRMPAEGTRYAATASLRSAWALLRTLMPDPRLDTWQFLPDWHRLDAAAKADKLSRLGCHELHLFIKTHDRAYFDAVVRPHLEHKLQKTFMDHLLLDRDLSRFRGELHLYQALNAAERALLARALGSGALAGALSDEVPDGPAWSRQAFSVALSGSADDSIADEDPSPPPPSAPMAFGGGGGFGCAAPQMSMMSRSARMERECEEDDDDESEECEDECKMDADYDDFGADMALSDAMALRARGSDGQGRLFKAPETTKELAEANFWEARELALAPSRFWAELAATGADEPFVSSALLGVGRGGSVNEVLLAMGVLQLPFEAGAGLTVTAAAGDGSELEATAAHPLVLYSQELAADPEPQLAGSSILVGQKLFEHVGGQKRYLTGSDAADLVVHQRYGCEVVVTNVSPEPAEVSVLTQVPQGAVPLEAQLATDVRGYKLAAFATQSVELAFYFPATGSFAQYPAHVAVGGRVVAQAAATPLTVVPEHRVVDTTSWPQLAERGSTADVVAFLSAPANNPAAVDLSLIAWRMRDADAYAAVLAALEARVRFAPALWAFAFVHRDAARLAQLVRASARLRALARPALASPLLPCAAADAVEHLEYRPFVNARAHQLGDRRAAPNPKANATLGRLLLGVACAADGASPAQLLSLAHHFLTHNRVDVGRALFERVPLSDLPAYHYMGAYLDLFDAAGGLRVARAAAQRFRDHPVPRWRRLFLELEAFAAEVDSGEPDAGDAAVSQEAAANEDPDLSVAVVRDGAALRVDAHALGATGGLRVALHRIDVEQFFSMSPFSSSASAASVNVRAARVLSAPGPAGGSGSVDVELPADLANANLLVEARADNLRATATRLCNQLRVTLSANYGVLRVAAADSGRALPAAYVKVYARKHDGSVAFYKDGYCDLAGKFPYAALSTDELPQVQQFAILVATEGHGAVVREVGPPQQ